MTASSLLGGWVVAAVVVMSILIFLATLFGHRRNWRKMKIRYNQLPRITKITRWTRIGAVALGLTAAITVGLTTQYNQGILVAPSLFAVITLVIIVGGDWWLLGRTPGDTQGKLTAMRAKDYLWWPLLILVILMIGLAVFTAIWAATEASMDNRTWVHSWNLDGVFDWGMRTPFVGSFYTVPLLITIPIVFLIALVGVLVVLKRPVFLPSFKYIALDHSFRRRTIRDIQLILLFCVVPTVSLMSIDIAWAFGTVGPGSQANTLVVALSSITGTLTLWLSSWNLANLLVLIPIEEDRKLVPKYRKPTVTDTEAPTQSEVPASKELPEQTLDLPQPEVDEPQVEPKVDESEVEEFYDPWLIPDPSTKTRVLHREVREAERAAVAEAKQKASLRYRTTTVARTAANAAGSLWTRITKPIFSLTDYEVIGGELPKIRGAKRTARAAQQALAKTLLSPRTSASRPVSHSTRTTRRAQAAETRDVLKSANVQGPSHGSRPLAVHVKQSRLHKTTVVFPRHPGPRQ
ncbi:MAG: hypothetical protein LBG99_05155 [Propionibacteriaceae bacterium]|jgi:hypothetical protein|nr:hypothetical protein [Propionibacteriaceae bacterium]